LSIDSPSYIETSPHTTQQVSNGRVKSTTRFFRLYRVRSPPQSSRSSLRTSRQSPTLECRDQVGDLGWLLAGRGGSRSRTHVTPLTPQSTLTTQLSALAGPVASHTHSSHRTACCTHAKPLRYFLAHVPVKYVRWVRRRLEPFQLCARSSGPDLSYRCGRLQTDLPPTPLWSAPRSAPHTARQRKTALRPS
jgi:hypothetical protein